MDLIGRIQAFMRQSAAQRYATLGLPPFTVFFHPNSVMPYLNYAIPDEALSDWPQPALDSLQAAFRGRGRIPRLEYVEEFCPSLGPALRRAGFYPESHNPLMVCNPDTFRPARPVPELAIKTLDQHAPLAEARRFLEIQLQGFSAENDEPVSEQDARALLAGLSTGRLLLAELSGQAIAVGLYSALQDGITEAMGISTLPDFRRRGIGSLLTSCLVKQALASGAEIVVLSAADERAGRVYQALGFSTRATMLAYRHD